jgi:hypothetical protein
VVKVTTNLIVYSRLGSDEKLKLTTKSEVQATIFWIYVFQNYIIKPFENQISFKKVYNDVTLDLSRSILKDIRIQI